MDIHKTLEKKMKPQEKVSIMIYNENQQLAIEGLQLLHSSLNNAFFTSSNIEGQKLLYPDIERRSLSVLLRGIYVNTTPHKILQKKAFSTQNFEGRIIIHDTFQITGEFAISKYEINYDLSNMKTFNVNLIGNGKINHL